MHITWFVTAVTLGLFSPLYGRAQPMELREKVTQLIDNVVRIEARYPAPSQGFGYVVAITPTHTYVLTARHVVAEVAGATYTPARSITVTSSDGQTSIVEKVTFLDEFLDAAIVQMPVSSAIWFKPAVLANAPVPNEETWLFGYQQRLAFIGEPGRVRDIRSNAIFLSNAGGWAGSSGAPVYSASGLLAIYSGVNGSMGAAIPVSAIEPLARAAGIPWQLTSSEWVTAAIELNIRRQDRLTQKVTVVAAGGLRRYDVPGNYTVPAGSYSLETDLQLQSCIPATFTVRRSNPAQAISVDCQPRFNGSWHGSFLGSVLITELQDSIYTFIASGPRGEPKRSMQGRMFANSNTSTEYQLDLMDATGNAVIGRAALSNDLKTLTLDLDTSGQKINDILRR